MTPELDLFVPGVVYLDIIFTGLEDLPQPGTEVWASGMGSCPGGIANLAVAAARLGLGTGLGTALATDAYGDFCAHILCEQEGIDLTASRRIDGHSPVTVSLAYNRDRSMITHGHPLPVGADGLVGELPACRAASVSLTKDRLPWVRRAKEAGTLVFADVGWDASAEWPAEVLDMLEDCHAFVPNAVEAMQYTRASTPEQALRRLAGLAPVVVVTCGGDGVLAHDARTGETVHVPGVPVPALDPTGAGDVFTAGFILGTLREWPLAQSLAFANLIAGLSVQHFGGSLSAPGWGDIADWWRQASGTPSLSERYSFLDDVIPGGEQRTVRRAGATVARLSDAHVS
ncbi:carbohydrate kinase family protein [Paractinoplanes brasiliensis]|uniref:Sugar/nucleoside kinase (Ribokinase family) n=1 Tax=Paractinoplanes brasiliensis TaxID=52695 RepID=A0A4V3C5S9_9ACTN|nr:PfkB family carbohydrate kinase [Actinoplanes brasiliensis]TDO31068.1 sugar/nucleoside kinase (ribokinase family) [Actinoplanes brasiliensis]GID33298.1 carbohydrate kinase [Actinoplanes brasiliensis]